MINALHLLWIVPLSATIGVVAAALMAVQETRPCDKNNTRKGGS